MPIVRSEGCEVFVVLVVADADSMLLFGDLEGLKVALFIIREE